jgi:hypothetical protein
MQPEAIYHKEATWVSLLIISEIREQTKIMPAPFSTIVENHKETGVLWSLEKTFMNGILHAKSGLWLA